MSAANDITNALAKSLTDGSFVKLSLGDYRGPDDLKNIYIRKIVVKREEKLSFTYHHKTKDIVKNYDTDEALQKIRRELNGNFHAATLMTTEFDLTLQNDKLRQNKPTHAAPPSTDHDRTKNRIVETKDKPYLHALGITDANGNVIKAAQDKYRQIDKYIEILGGLVKDLPKDKIKSIVDMGAGKGYLTFALYDYLTNTLKMNVKVIGVEARKDLVNLCNTIAADSGFENLKFEQGTIQSHKTKADILIALHACDTATDDAIHKGLQSNAELIVVAPCCHKQIRREMEKSGAENNLSPLTRHGIFLERQAEMVTDSIRALVLEQAGYKTKVFEFIGGEHTPKNVMITATNAHRPDASASNKINDLKDFFGISSHYLEQLAGLTR